MRLYDYDASGNCLKVRLLLGLLDRPYERVPVDIFAGDTLTDAFGALNPVRETPVLELEPGVAIAQSSAILWYLADGTPFLPAGPLPRALVLQWLAFEQERVMGGIGGPRFRRITGRPAIEGRLEIGAQALELLDVHLRAPDPVVRQERRALGEEPQDRRRLGERGPVVELQHRRLAERVERAVRVGERVAREDVGRHPLVRAPQQREQQADLVAVGGGGVVVEPHRRTTRVPPRT